MTCNIDPELQSKEDTPQENNDDGLQDDEFLKKYFQERIEEMKQKLIQKYKLNSILHETIANQKIYLNIRNKFGKLLELNNENFLNEIDNENSSVTIVIHIYDKRPECKILNEYLETIAQEYDTVKFCKVQSYEISLSEKFVRLI